MVTHPTLISQMLSLCNEPLPTRWESKWLSMKKELPDETDRPASTLQEWLTKAYLHNDKRPELTDQELVKIGDLVGRMLRLEPSSRATARAIASDPWLRRD
jgi:serine/threonine-protein kinase SRPK3